MTNEIISFPSTLDTIDLAKQLLIKYGYANRTTTYYQNTWKQIAQFIRDNPTVEHVSVRTLSPKFLKSRGMSSSLTPEMSWSEEQTHRGLQLLITLQETGLFGVNYLGRFGDNYHGRLSEAVF